MPAEQVLKRGRGPVGPNAGEGGSSRAFRARLEEWAAGIAPPLLIGGLALAGGGFALDDRHLAGLAVWVLIAGLLVLGAAGRATLGRPFYWSAGLIGAFALWSALSSLWSASVELSVVETDRVLVYFGFFVATFLLAQTREGRQRFGEGLTIALIFVAVLALASRLLPDILSVNPAVGAEARLSYPLGYWNADGVLFGLATGLVLWLSRRSLVPALRWLAVASLPAILLALYLTYSRGGLLAVLIAGGCLVALSHDRLWLLATLGTGALGALPAVLAVQDNRLIAENIDAPGLAGQGHEVLAILVGGTLLAVALFAGLRALERGRGRVTGRALEASRNPRVLRGIALAAALLAIGAVIAVGGRAWDQFSNSDLQPPGSAESHIAQVGSSGRDDFWRVAIDSFEEEPVLGHGAGTFRYSWYLLRDLNVTNADAHSLYLQAFAELGLFGGLLVLAMVGFLLWTGFCAWRHARGPQRDLYAALLGVALAFAVCAAIDWFWLVAALAAVFFLATGVLVAARCAQLAEARAAGNGQGSRRRFGLALGGLALAWITALALVGPLLADREIKASNEAAADGNFPSAVSHAENAKSIEPWATTPYRQLGLLAELEGNYPLAVERLDEAIDREPENFLLYYIRARIHDKAGDEGAARADLEEAMRLNPEERCLHGGFEGCG
ncbi:MAG: hypothetical protein QOE75_1987 [Solirubrobacterales bacterium]|jgi:hypothetical protein|nr:hypothetical protein [Solirubrobacterales bacterium]